ncbi:MAG: ABC transporter permease, partial [Opitutaceae bacterium]
MLSALRQTLRRLVHERGFTATVLLTLALCIGANVAIYAVVDAILVRPLPFPAADRLVRIFNAYPNAGIESDGSSFTNYYERRGHIEAFSELAIYSSETAIVGQPGAARREAILRVSPEFFDTLGVRLALGRTFTEDEMTFQTANVAILTDAGWREYFAADPRVLGREIRVDGSARTVVGILPPGFRFLSSAARIYFPRASDPNSRGPNQRYNGSVAEMIGRLKPGVSLPAAQAQIASHNAAIEAASPYPQFRRMTEMGFRSRVVSLHADHVKSIRPMLVLLQTGVFFLL